MDRKKISLIIEPKKLPAQTLDMLYERNWKIWEKLPKKRRKKSENILALQCRAFNNIVVDEIENRLRTSK